MLFDRIDKVFVTQVRDLTTGPNGTGREERALDDYDFC